MTKDQTPFELEIIYCGAWGGLPEANRASKLVRTVFPNASINQHSPGVTRNLVIVYEGKEIYNKQGGDGQMTQQKSTVFLKKLQQLVSGKWY